MGAAGVASLSFLLIRFGSAINYAGSMVVFFFLDLLEVVLCNVYMIVDYALEAKWKPCYCRLARKNTATSTTTTTEPQKEQVSCSLFSRSLLALILSKATAYTLVPGILEMFEGKTRREASNTVRRWSECDCRTCNSWSTSPDGGSLFVHVEDSADGRAKEDVVFLHGFVSSSAFWTETVFPNFTEATRSSYRLLAVDLLGFGMSPKPPDSLYTLEEHVDVIECSVLQQYNVGSSFHIVAHSLGCILALALAARRPEAIRSITLVAPPYFPGATGNKRTQSVMHQLAPRRVWPVMTLGVSLACWYEHISRTFCLIVCKNHRLWESIFKLVTLNRIRTFMIKGFFCHTHNAAWHTLHNVLIGSGERMDGYLEFLQEKLTCDVAVFHGQHDNLIPVECSRAVRSRLPRARLNVVDNEDHITIVLGRQNAFARELQDIWKSESHRYNTRGGTESKAPNKSTMGANT